MPMALGKVRGMDDMPDWPAKHLPHVYIVLLVWEGESGADMMPLGIYANELHARRVAKDHRLAKGEHIEIGRSPILDVPEEEHAYIESRGGDPAATGIYSRRRPEDDYEA